MSERYAIVDIETTGGMFRSDRITEIAVVVLDEQREVDRFESLVHPERSVPPYISRMTGITDEMLADAPKFYEIAKQVVKITEGCVFIAHNVQFDYRFIREEFRRLGYMYRRRRICTVKLSRKTFPGLKKYSLGHLIKHFEIEVTDRHRAMADVEATVELFRHIHNAKNARDQISLFINSGVKSTHLPDTLTVDFLHDIPERCGVYYLKDSEGEIIYIGKSKNIQSRVFQHFAGQKTKNNRLREQVHEVDWTITGSELISLLLESREIKEFQPRYNRAQKRNSFNHYLVTSIDENGYRRILHQPAHKTGEYDHVLGAYPTRSSAKEHLKHLRDALQLCSCLLGLHDPGNACMYKQMDHCRGAYFQEEDPESYNLRMEEALSAIDQRFDEDFLLVEDGPGPEDISLILVQYGKIWGYGFCSKEVAIRPDRRTSWIKHIDKVIYTPEIQRITSNYVKQNKNLEKVILPNSQPMSY